MQIQVILEDLLKQLSQFLIPFSSSTYKYRLQSIYLAGLFPRRRNLFPPYCQSSKMILLFKDNWYVINRCLENLLVFLLLFLVRARSF